MMERNMLLLMVIFVLPLLSFSQGKTALHLDNYQWQNRLILLFSATQTNSEYQQQVEKFKSKTDGLKERDVTVFHLLGDGSAFVGDRKIAASEVEQLIRKFKINPARFTVLLIGKDGTEKLRQSTPLQVKKLFRIIDAMPMRQREIQQQ